MSRSITKARETYILAATELANAAADLQRLTKIGSPDWIREARRAYTQADIAAADAHLNLEIAVNQELQVQGVRV